MPVIKIWSCDHKEKKAVCVSDISIEHIIEKAKEKNIHGSKIFLIDGTEIDDDDTLREFLGEPLVIANEKWDEGKQSLAFDVESHTTASERTAPNTPSSTISNNSDIEVLFQMPYEKFPSVLMSKLNEGGPILSSDVNTVIRIIGDEFIHHKNLKTRANYRLIAQELCERFPQLYDRDDDTKQLIGTGYHTIFKKIEERIHYLKRPNKTAASSCSPIDTTTRKKSKIVKNLSAGCKEWQPSVPVINEEEEITPESKKTWLKSNACMKERDESKVELFMKDTYSYQRIYLNTTPAPTITSIADEWPVLLEEKYMIMHFDRLCGLNANLCVDTFLSKSVELHKKLCALLPKKHTKLLNNDSENDDNNDSTAALLNLISIYFNEDSKNIYEKYEEPVTKADIAARAKVTAPNIKISGIENIAYLVVENTIVSETSTPKSSLQLLFAAYFNFNMAYPVQSQNTLEFLQRFIFKINPTEGSKVRKGRTLNKVLSLLSKLRSK